MPSARPSPVPRCPILGWRLQLLEGRRQDVCLHRRRYAEVSVKTDSIETAQMLIDAGIGLKAPYLHRSWT